MINKNTIKRYIQTLYTDKCIYISLTAYKCKFKKIIRKIFKNKNALYLSFILANKEKIIDYIYIDKSRLHY